MSRSELQQRYGWLTGADLDFLEESPWIGAFIEDGDTDLGDAIGRCVEALSAARAELSKSDVSERMVTAGGLETTALRPSTAESES